MADGNGVTPKQKLFVKEYLVDLNATRAAISAGYSENGGSVAGARLLRNAKVKEAISKSSQKRTEKLEITADYVLKNIRDVVEKALVRGEGAIALKGLELLGKYRKLFTDKVEHSGQIENVNFDATHVSDEQLAAWEASLAPAGSNQG